MAILLTPGRSLGWRFGYAFTTFWKRNSSPAWILVCTPANSQSWSRRLIRTKLVLRWKAFGKLPD